MGDPSAAVCPKCGAPRDPRACPRCGLSADRMDSYAATRAEVPAALTAAWQHATAQWDDPARHDEVLRLIVQHDAHAWAAARYRSRSGDPIGDRQLERLGRAAEAALYASAAAPPARRPTPYRAVLAVLVLLVVMALAGLMFTALVRRDRGGRAQPAPGQPVPRSQPAGGPALPAPGK